jgi:hypothetical protein
MTNDYVKIQPDGSVIGREAILAGFVRPYVKSDAKWLAGHP